MKHSTLLLRAAGVTFALGLAAASALAQSEPMPPSQPGQPVAPGQPDQPALPETTPTPAPMPSPSDQVRVTNGPTSANEETSDFIAKVSQLSDESVRLSQIATDRANNAQVKTLAQQVQQSSQALQTELGSLAQTRNVLLPTGRAGDAFGGDDTEKWARKDGKDFDEDFVKRVVKLQKDAIDTLEDYAKDGEADPEMAAFAQKHIPVLREQLRQAQSIEKLVD